MILNISTTENHVGTTLIAMLIAKLFRWDLEDQDEALQQSSYHDEKGYCCVYGYTSVRDVQTLEKAMVQIQETCGQLLGGTRTDPKKSFGWLVKPKWTYKSVSTLNIKFKCTRWEELEQVELDDTQWNDWLAKLELDANTGEPDDDADY